MVKVSLIWSSAGFSVFEQEKLDMFLFFHEGKDFP